MTLLSVLMQLECENGSFLFITIIVLNISLVL